MLKKTETGVEVLLTGKSGFDKGFLWSAVLGLFALAVAVVASLFDVRYALGAIFALAVASFFFNRYKAKKQRTPTITGKVVVSAFALRYEMLGKQHSLVFGDTLSIVSDELGLLLIDKDKSARLTGFESEAEKNVVKAVLLGKEIYTRAVNVCMQETPRT
ncbi:MAG: hypothetical protein Q4B88_04790 [Moraxella sp.]|nr:hypothetical protein [Moraxella sp.]